MIIWWHVVTADRKVFGFSSKDGVVQDAPYEQYHWRYEKLENIRKYFKQQDTVVKVGEVPSNYKNL